MLELLSPAGSYEGFLAAVSAGADAVYLGGRAFGARAYAQNFSDEEIIQAIDTAHIYNKRVYLTLNTLCKQREFDDAIAFLEPFYIAGLDGVIVQDIGLIKAVKEIYPDIEIHASTQMTLTGPMGAKYLKEMGACRIVPARELSLKEIKRIHDETGIEIEAFIHGAMCYSYSGQCLMSSFLGTRSGNRGRCAQPCRLPVRVFEDKKPLGKKGEEYLLSMKDLCTLKDLPDMIESGITSFKIEGRMKSSDYTGFVTSVYRKYIDLYLEKGRAGYKVSEDDYNELVTRYRRSAPNNGYLYRHNSRSLITLLKPSYDGEGAPSGEQAAKQPTGLKVDIEGWFYKNRPSKLSLKCNDAVVCIEGEECQEAIKQPLSEDAIKKQLSKLGQSEFLPGRLSINMDDDIFMPLKSLNELRRNAIIKLTNEMLTGYRRFSDSIFKERAVEYTVDKKLIKETQPKKTELTILVEKEKQLQAVIDSAVDFAHIYIESDLLIKSLNKVTAILSKNKQNNKFVLALPYIYREKAENIIKPLLENEELMKLFSGFLVRNYEELYFIKNNLKGKEIITDFNLYSFNFAAAKALTGYGATVLTLPLELNIHEIRERANCDKSEILVYGKIPLMISAGCVVNTTAGCKKNKNGEIVLSDRYKKEFLVQTDCSFCYNRILNSVPVLLMSETETITESGIRYMRLQLTTEDYRETLEIIRSFTDGNTAFNGDFTKGHFRKSVE